MKKNDWIFLLSTLTYSYLFYRQSAGLNFLLFSIILMILLIIRNKNVWKNKAWGIAAAGTLASGFCVFYFANGLSVIANVISLLLLSALSFSPDTSVITSLFFSVFSIGASLVFMIMDTIDRSQREPDNKSKRSGFIKFMLYGIPVFVLLLFFFLYKGANPVFDDLTKNINLNFISVEWIAFTALGSFIMYGFFYHKVVAALELKDRSVPNTLNPSLIKPDSWLAKNLNIESEVLSGIILLSLLNILLLVVNGLDVNYLWCDGTLPKGLNYSTFVHQGTGLLITSIIIAILIIMFYFRGSVNFYAKNKGLKFLACAWIIQNAFMIISTAFRNQLYVNEYSLTYKRIGVYVWLLLALIGLITTFIKIMGSKTNWYLFRTNAWLFYGVLVLSCFVNWDLVVTDFNINRSVTTNRPLDKMYLLELSDKSLPRLLTLSDSIREEHNHEDSSFSRSSGFDEYTENDPDFKLALDRHLYDFLSMMSLQEWRSWNFSDKKKFNEIMKLNEEGKIKGLKLNGYRYLPVEPISGLTNIRSLDFSNSHFYPWESLEHFQQLENLTLSGNGIKDLSKFPYFPHLKTLNISINNISNIYPIGKYKELESLDISMNTGISDFSPLLSLKKLNHLTIGNITRAGMETLQRTFPNVKIEATILN